MNEKSVDNNQMIGSMDDFNSLSNDDLRNRLQNEFHFGCGPITGSTRGVYLKKLIKLVEQNHQNNDLFGDNNHQNNGNNEEVIDNGPETPPRVSAIRSSPSRNRSSPRRRMEEELPSVLTKTSTPKNRRNSSNSVSVTKKSVKSSRKTMGVMSDLLMEPPIGMGHSSGGSEGQANSHSSTLNNYSSESSENEEKIDDKLLSLSKIRKSPRKKLSTPPVPRPLQDQLSVSQRVPFARPYPPSLTPMSNASKLSRISSLTRPPLRSPLTPGQSSAKLSQLANYSDSDDTEQEQNDYIRDRLLRHRPGLNISSITTKASPTTGTSGTGFEETNSYSSSNFISFAILVIVFLFFVFIFSFYFYTRISSAPKLTVDLKNFDFIRQDLIAPVCVVNEPFANSDNCLKHESDIMPALTIAKEIKTFIDKSILNFYCGSDQKITAFSDFKSVDTNVIRRAIRDSIKVVKTEREGIKVDESEDVVFLRDFNNAITLIQLNPNWQLRTVSDNLVDEVSAIIITDVYPLNLPYRCHWILTLKMNFYKIFSVFLSIFLIFGTFLYYKRSKKLATEQQDLVYDLVEKSLELLQSPDNPQSMPVLHIRDTLLTASERKTSKYKKVWNKVVKHIESTESRVKVDIENIEGDDYKTWKWMALNTANNENQIGGNGSTIIRTGNIEWQGQAFNIAHTPNTAQSTPNANNGVNASKPSFSAPTPFLKIRNMFDEESKLSNPFEWKNKIRSAVLQKISIASQSGSHGVLHLEVEDSPEGLVYLKCDSIESATDAFNALHGWWCEKKLVSVKFLKPERYHQRFPTSVHSTTPISSTQ